MPDPLNAAGNEQTMPEGNTTYGYTQKMSKIKKSNMGYTQNMTKIKKTNPKGASVNDLDDTVAKPSSPAEYTPYKMKASGHNNSPIEKNYGSKSDRGFGVPFTGGVGSNEMESGVGDKFEGMPYSENASPAKGLFGAIGSIFKKGAKKVGGALGGALGLAKKGEGGGVGGKVKAMDDRISALEESMSAGGEGELSTADPMYGGVGGAAAANTATMGAVDSGAVLSGTGMSDSTKPLAEEMMKKKKMQASWGGVGQAQAV